MRKSTDSLGKIKIASPCDADWNEMPGDARRRHCAMCGLNVYNLSEMTRREAENFLINAEGRVCVQIRRRRDGTVITRDCPVGWQKLKRRVSRTATAALGLIAGFFGGNIGFTRIELDDLDLKQKVPPVSVAERETESGTKIKRRTSPYADRGGISNLQYVKTQIKDEAAQPESKPRVDRKRSPVKR